MEETNYSYLELSKIRYEKEMKKLKTLKRAVYSVLFFVLFGTFIYVLGNENAKNVVRTVTAATIIVYTVYELVTTLKYIKK